MRSWQIAALVTTLGAIGVPAWGHQAPSPDRNNHYLKVTCLPDQVRVSFTALFGEGPGRGLRARMDADGDGAITPQEGQAFGQGVLDEVASSVAVTADGRAPAGWRLTDVGLGTPVTAAGAFSVDLEASIPLAGASHELTVVDGWRVPDAGEREIRLEESPGMRFVSAHLAREAKGLQLRWAWPDDARDPANRKLLATCVGQAAAPAVAPPAHSRRWLWLTLVVVLVGGGAMVLAVRRAATSRTGT